MSVILNLPTELDPEEVIPYDSVVIYKRLGAYTHKELVVLPLGTSQYSDSNGRVNDEYHIVFRELATNVESPASSIYRALYPYQQRSEDGAVVVTLELDTVSTIPTVDFVAIYRRKPPEAAATRIALIPIGQARYQDPDGEPGDIYHSTFVDTTNGAESQPGDYITANAGSGFIVVSGRFEDVSGDPAEAYLDRDREHYDIQATLKLRRKNQLRTPTAQGQVISQTFARARMDENGVWSLVLVPNNLIQPRDSYYEFKYRGRLYNKQVHSQNGRSQNFALLPDVDPELVKS
jgi:hypothetical protein